MHGSESSQNAGCGSVESHWEPLLGRDVCSHLREGNETTQASKLAAGQVETENSLQQLHHIEDASGAKCRWAGFSRAAGPGRQQQKHFQPHLNSHSRDSGEFGQSKSLQAQGQLTGATCSSVALSRSEPCEYQPVDSQDGVFRHIFVASVRGRLAKELAVAPKRELRKPRVLDRFEFAAVTGSVCEESSAGPCTALLGDAS